MKNIQLKFLMLERSYYAVISIIAIWVFLFANVVWAQPANLRPLARAEKISHEYYYSDDIGQFAQVIDRIVGNSSEIQVFSHMRKGPALSKKQELISFLAYSAFGGHGGILNVIRTENGTIRYEVLISEVRLKKYGLLLPDVKPKDQNNFTVAYQVTSLESARSVIQNGLYAIPGRFSFNTTNASPDEDYGNVIIVFDLPNKKIVTDELSHEEGARDVAFEFSADRIGARLPAEIRENMLRYTNSELQKRSLLFADEMGFLIHEDTDIINIEETRRMNKLQLDSNKISEEDYAKLEGDLQMLQMKREEKWRRSTLYAVLNQGIAPHDTALRQQLVTNIVTQLKEDLKSTLGIDENYWKTNIARGREGYSLERHIEMVIGQFEKYFYGDNIEALFKDAGIDRSFFRLVLALHDIGKPQGEDGHETTKAIVVSYLTKLGIDGRRIRLALSLIDGDPIGPYLAGKGEGFDGTARFIETAARDRARLPIKLFFKLLTIYYQSDAGSYTSDAGGLNALDDRFSYDRVNSRFRLHETGSRLVFSDEYETLFTNLETKVGTMPDARRTTESKPGEEEIRGIETKLLEYLQKHCTPANANVVDSVNIILDSQTISADRIGNALECIASLSGGAEMIIGFVEENFPEKSQNPIDGDIQFMAAKAIHEATSGQRRELAIRIINRIPFDYFHRIFSNSELDPGRGKTTFFMENGYVDLLLADADPQAAQTAGSMKMAWQEFRYNSYAPDMRNAYEKAIGQTNFARDFGMGSNVLQHETLSSI